MNQLLSIMYHLRYNNLHEYLRRSIAVTLLILCFHLPGAAANISQVTTYAAPAGEKLCGNYSVTVGTKNIDIYTAKVACADPARRFKAVDDLLHSADYYDVAAFGYFALSGPATVTVTLPSKAYSVKILPASFNIRLSTFGKSVSFMIKPGQNVTLEFNGDIVHSLHLFADGIYQNMPRPGAPHFIYFGPGIHEVSSMVIGDNTTVYIAGGAIVKAVVGKDEKYSVEPSGLHNYLPTFIINGSNVKFMGQGIIDASACPVHARNFLIVYRSHHVTIDGIIIRNSSGWTLPVVQSDDVTINNVKIIGYRANTDGIDINNSTNVTVDNCFIRTNDDLVVVKTFEKQGVARHIIVKRCVLWNQLANALSIGAEVREDVADVLFTDCDIIHDTGREWSLHIFQCDSTRISNIRFENIRIAQSRQLISLWIGKAQPSATKSPGEIDHVSFKNIDAYGEPLAMELIGGDSLHPVRDVVFEHILLNGKPLEKDQVRFNPFTEQIRIE